MKRSFTRQLKSFFTFSKSEQRGIAVLLLLVVVVLTVNMALPLFFEEPDGAFKEFNAEVERFLKEKKRAEDSILIERLQNSGAIDRQLVRKKLNPFPFDPNKLSKKKWMELGLTRKQAESILKYESHGGKFYKKEDLKKLRVISDVEYEILAPYVKITGNYVTELEVPRSKMRPRGNTTWKHTNQRQTIEINSADSAAWVHQLGISPWLASRIVKYRSLLGGFYEKKQLKEVYGIKQKLFNDMEPWLQVDTAKIVRIDINRAGFKEILRHPYFDYEMTKKIVNGRKSGEGYHSPEELKRQTGFPDTTMQKIKHYLYIRPLKNYRDE